MPDIGFDIIIVLLLVLANGLFSMAEMSMVSARKAKLQKLAEEGNLRAKLAYEIACEPNSFLSTGQIGITLIGILAGAFGGATIAEKIRFLFEPIPWIGRYSESISLFLVVLAITILSIIIGELIPKRLALLHPEPIAIFMARPIQLLSQLAKPFVDMLGWIIEKSFALFGVKTSRENVVSEDEVKMLMQEGVHAGVIQKAEKEMVDGVLDLDTLKVEDLFTSRTRIIWLNVDDPDEVNWRKIVASGHSHFPVYQGNRDLVLGMVSVKSLWANLSLANKADLRTLVNEPTFVPSSMSAIALLETFKKTGKHVALVSDEFGGVEGLVTLNDVLEAIVGELPSKDQPKRYQARLRPDGSWLADAMIDIDELKETIHLDALPSNDDQDEYQTLSGFLMKHFERIPDEGDKFEYGKFLFEVIDMDRHRIDKVLITPPRKDPLEEQSPTC